MSKYIKLEDAIHNIDLEVTGRKEYTGDMKANLFFALDDLPTIEVSEDCVSRKWLEENAKEFGDYYENTVWAVPLSVLTDAPSVVPKTQIETQNSNENSNEDAISREWLISFIDAGHLRNPNELCYSERGVVELIKHAPSVVPSCQKNRQVGRAEGEWLLDGRCSNCLQAPLTTHKTYCPNCGARMSK